MGWGQKNIGDLPADINSGVGSALRSLCEIFIFLFPMEIWLRLNRQLASGLYPPPRIPIPRSRPEARPWAEGSGGSGDPYGSMLTPVRAPQARGNGDKRDNMSGGGKIKTPKGAPQFASAELVPPHTVGGNFVRFEMRENSIAFSYFALK